MSGKPLVSSAWRPAPLRNPPRPFSVLRIDVPVRAEHGRLSELEGRPFAQQVPDVASGATAAYARPVRGAAVAVRKPQALKETRKDLKPIMPAFTHHIFVCGNVRAPGHPRGSCDPEGNQALRDAFKRELKKAGFGALARANHSGCLEQCEHGPMVVIYPQGIWYGRVRPEDVPRIVSRTVLGGEVLNDLVVPDACLNNPGCPHRRGPSGGPPCD